VNHDLIHSKNPDEVAVEVERGELEQLLFSGPPGQADVT